MAGDTEFCSLFEDQLGGTRPDWLFEVRPLERNQRRTVEQIVDSSLVVPSLDVPVPQRVRAPGLEVPKISSSSRHSCKRRVRFAQQMAEQLVEVPAIVSDSSLHGLVEQNEDIPVPYGRGGRAGGKGLQGLRPGQVSTALGRADHVAIPVPRSGGLQGSRPRQASHSRGAADEAFTCFSHFSQKQKKCEVGSALGVGTECGLYSVHAVGSA